MGKTAIKSTMIIDEFVHHPGSGRATDYQNDVATCRSPSIPEVFQGRDKVERQQEKAIIGSILHSFKPIIHIFKHYWLNSTFLSANNAFFLKEQKYLKEHAAKIQLIFKNPNKNKQNQAFPNQKFHFYRCISKPKIPFLQMHFQTKNYHFHCISKPKRTLLRCISKPETIFRSHHFGK